MKKLFPTAFTIANLICGFLAILVNDAFYSPLLIVLGAFYDVFDGMLARKLNAVTQMGKELDSLADMVSFGIAPAYLYFQLMPKDSHWTGYMGPIAIVVGGALRLAKFNTKPSSAYFEGLAIPSSGLFFAGLVFATSYNQVFIIDILAQPMVYVGLALFMMIMNLINMRMFSIKSIGLDMLNKIMMGLFLLGFLLSLIFIFPIAVPFSILWYILLAVLMNIILKTTTKST